MRILKEDNTIVFTQEESSVEAFKEALQDVYNQYISDNIILVLTTEVIKNEDLTSFFKLSNNHREAKQSFVMVSQHVDIDYSPQELVIVPTLQEAHDFIEMEDMERDLGF
ncbi:MAG: ribonuclease Z [Flavobacteriaceae bacterium]|nr:ribonuclease Z [Flavobacteriaceae bacterium]